MQDAKAPECFCMCIETNNGHLLVPPAPAAEDGHRSIGWKACSSAHALSCRMALVEAERALERWATDEDSLEGQGAVIWRTAQVQRISLSQPLTGLRWR